MRASVFSFFLAHTIFWLTCFLMCAGYIQQLKQATDFIFEIEMCPAE